MFHPNKLEQIRHSLSHLLAVAILEKHPNAKLGIGPVIENGFYYDFDFGAEKFTDADLPVIENRIKELVKKDLSFSKKIISAKEAKKLFNNQNYKLELIEELEEQNQDISIYTTGDNLFVDLCAGPHIESTKEINPDAFKLEKIAGAYWKGSEKNQMLTRIYGLAFETKQELENYLKMTEEAEKRDHRKLGKELELFMLHDVAPGMPFFLPNGMILLNELIKFVRKYSYGEGYREIKTPQILNSDLWKISGHWENYKEDMFRLHHSDDDMDMGVKPMNCPAHMLVFKRDIRSYRDLPLRLAETTTLYRNEKSGTLHGLTRVRSLSQDDTHIFASDEQIFNEISAILEKIKNIYTIFGLEIDEIHLSTRPEKFLGEKSVWDKAENNLKEALEKAGLKYKINEGDGAFYGPKIDVKIKDAIGRQWQLATIQLDYQMPLRFGLEYVSGDGTPKTPVVIHRAILGSMERFLGIIIEHFAGAFPFWLSPVQVKVINVSENHLEYANEVLGKLKVAGIRAELSGENETLGKKIRAAEMQKVPYVIIVGEKEIEAKTISVRKRSHGDLGAKQLQDFIEEIKEENKI